MKVYTLSRSRKYSIIILQLLFMAVTLGSLARWLIFSYDVQTAYWAFPLALLLTGLCLWQIQEARISQLVIGPDFIREDSATGSKELLFQEIEGIQCEGFYLLLIPFSADRKKIKISIHLSGYLELTEWLYERFTDLDLQREEAAEQERIDKIRYGIEKEHTAADHRRIAIITWIFNPIAILAAITLIFFRKHPLDLYALTINIVMPWLVLAAIHYYKDFITMESAGISLKLEWALIAPSFSLSIFALGSINILDHKLVWTPFWVAALVIGLLFCTVIMPTIRAYKKSEVMKFIAGHLFILLMYSYGALITINSCFDNSIPLLYQSQVTGKKITGSKGKSYLLQIAPGGPVTKTLEVNVKKKEYDEISISDTVTISLKKGLLNIPWYTSRQNNKTATSR